MTPLHPSRHLLACAFVLIFILSACGRETPPEESAREALKETFDTPPAGTATKATRAHNAEAIDRVSNFANNDIEFARRGLVARYEEPVIMSATGELVWRFPDREYLATEAPETVNPSLWRQSQLTAEHGLFEVAEGVYQARGFDLAVMTLIEGDSGWIIIDPLLTTETAAAALDLANRALGAKPVRAVIYTHSHADHFGGVRGVLTNEQISQQAIPIIAPAGFTVATLSENLLAGNHMARRAGLMFGTLLPPGSTGQIGVGLGPGMANGTVSFVPPTDEVAAPFDMRVIDGVTFEFIDAANTEAPSEFMFYLPEKRILCTAEVASATFHNALTLRGAKARNLLRWSEVIDEVLQLYGDKSDVLIASHHWPVWEPENIVHYLENQRDIYRYTHDQALRRANMGEGLTEIGTALEVPESLATDATTIGYYGTLNHNAKAVYQYYFGWWDGVPARFNQHPPEARAVRLVNALGGIDPTIDQGRSAFEEGDYRWAAELFDAVVFAYPENARARAWLAATYEQLGFQAESGAWRNYYLSSAYELREGAPRISRTQTANKEFLQAVPTGDLFTAMATQYTPGTIENTPYTLQFSFPDREEQISVEIRKDVIIPRAGIIDADPRATFTVDRAVFDQIILGEANATMLALRGTLKIDGDRGAVRAFFDALESPAPDFNLLTP